MSKASSRQALSKAEKAIRNARSRECHRIRRHEEWIARHPAPVRTSTNPPPTLAELRAAYDVRNESPENMIRLGSLMEDLEAAYPLGYKYEYDASTDFHFVDYDAPWQNGIKGFLRQDPFLLSKYKTLMRYKKLSADFRRAIGLEDPTPTGSAFQHIFKPSNEYAEGMISQHSFRTVQTFIKQLIKENKNEQVQILLRKAGGLKELLRQRS